MRYIGILLAIVVSDAVWSWRSLQSQDTPEDVVASAFSAIAQRNWTAFRDLLHPDAVVESRQRELGMLVLVAERRRAGESLNGGYNPQDVVIADHLASVGDAPARYFNNATIAELAALSAGEFFVRWLAAAYPPEQHPFHDIAGRERRIIGSLVRGNTAWVLYRHELREQDGDVLHITTPGKVEELPLRLHEGRWRILLNHELAHGPDVTGIFDEFAERTGMTFSRSEPTRRQVRRLSISTGSPRHINAVPDPATVVENAFRAFAERDWPRLAALIESRRLAEFQREAIQHLVILIDMLRMRRSGEDLPSAMVFMTSDGSTRAAAAERAEFMAGSPTIRELRRLSPREFFVRWSTAAYGTRPDTVTAASRTMLGVVFEGQDRAHVLYESSDRQMELEGAVMRMPLQFSNGRWHILLNREIGDVVHLAMVVAP